MQEAAEERERAAHQKELEVARLRAMQEKIQDNRSVLVGAAVRQRRSGVVSACGSGGTAVGHFGV